MTVEPLNNWQKEALQGLANPGNLGQGGITGGIDALKALLANPQATAANYTNPQATQFNTQAGQLVTQGTAPITQAAVQELANPFSQALKDQLTEAGARARASLTAQQGQRGAASFGDSSFGIRSGMLDQSLLQGEGDINYKTFTDALAALENQRGRSIQGAGTLGNLAAGAQNVTSNAVNQGLNTAGALFDAGTSATNTGFNTLNQKLNAGNSLQAYNQGVNNLIGNDILASQNYEGDNLSALINMLSQYGGGGSQILPTTNSITQGGSIATILASLLKGSGSNQATNQVGNNLQGIGGLY
jgi:hypothetical protein